MLLLVLLGLFACVFGVWMFFTHPVLYEITSWVVIAAMIANLIKSKDTSTAFHLLVAFFCWPLAVILWILESLEGPPDEKV